MAVKALRQGSNCLTIRSLNDAALARQLQNQWQCGFEDVWKNSSEQTTPS
ncbi:hypothetical protein TRICHSKD4_4251 [Roseibium sp. TrichSKD4]|nr:hypothetical protein TRICHSKD4_4251 [Roseibium sp. TrichSKD4]